MNVAVPGQPTPLCRIFQWRRARPAGQQIPVHWPRHIARQVDRRYAGASNSAQALATADTWSCAFDPGAVAQPPFSTKSPWDHESAFLSAAKLAEASVAR